MMTLDEMKLAVCEKLPELIFIDQPEIKSAEEHLNDFLRITGFSDEEINQLVTPKQTEQHKQAVEFFNRRDLAIWNAAIERGAEVVQQVSDDKTWGISNPDTRYADAILNLKRKE